MGIFLSFFVLFGPVVKEKMLFSDISTLALVARA